MRPTTALVYLRAAEATTAQSAIRRAMAKRRYARFRGQIPAHYPRPSPEIIQLAVQREASDGWVAVALEDPSSAFLRAKEWSDGNDAPRALGLRRDFTKKAALKVYAQGHPIAKCGEDPDLEVSYPIAKAHAPQIEAAARELGLGGLHGAWTDWWTEWAHSTHADIDDLAALMALPYHGTHYRAVAEHEAFEAQTWVRKGSRLLSSGPR